MFSLRAKLCFFTKLCQIDVNTMPEAKSSKGCVKTFYSRNDQPCISLRKSLGSLTRQSTGNKSISKSSENVVRSDKIRQNSGNTSDSINCMNSPIYWASCLYHV